MHCLWDIRFLSNFDFWMILKVSIKIINALFQVATESETWSKIMASESNSLARILNTDLEDLFSKKFVLSRIYTVHGYFHINNVSIICSVRSNISGLQKYFRSYFDNDIPTEFEFSLKFDQTGFFHQSTDLRGHKFILWPEYRYLSANNAGWSFVAAPELQRKKCILDLKHNESFFQFRIFQILNRHSDRRLKSLHG